MKYYAIRSGGWWVEIRRGLKTPQKIVTEAPTSIESKRKEHYIDDKTGRMRFRYKKLKVKIVHTALKGGVIMGRVKFRDFRSVVPAFFMDSYTPIEIKKDQVTRLKEFMV
jgi:hypothetical protein